ncbi:MAG: hypothetical protein ACREDL_23490, partial [Bradyrhizobium sp.]
QIVLARAADGDRALGTRPPLAPRFENFIHLEISGSRKIARVAGNGDRAPILERRKNASAMLGLVSSHQRFPNAMAAAGNRVR